MRELQERVQMIIPLKLIMIWWSIEHVIHESGRILQYGGERKIFPIPGDILVTLMVTFFVHWTLYRLEWSKNY